MNKKYLNISVSTHICLAYSIVNYCFLLNLHNKLTIRND